MENGNPSRRDFMKSATIGGVASAGVFSIVSPNQVRGDVANRRVRVACIGQGGRGRMITRMVDEHPGLELAAVVDYFPKIAAEAAAKHGLPESKAFSGLQGYQRAIDSGVDAVVLKTPPYFFPIHAAAAVEAGCHVYMAKPIAVDVPGCLSVGELGERSTKNEKVFHVDFQWRYLPYLVKCVEYLREGRMDDIRFLRATYNDEGHEDRKFDCVSGLFTGLRWTSSRELGGDKIVSAGIHAIDTAMYILGTTPEKVIGTLQQSRKNPVNSAYDTSSLTYTFPGGVLMNYSGDQFRNYHFEIDKFSGVTAYADHGYLQTFYGKGRTQMRNADWRYKGGEDLELYTWGAAHNVDLFHRCITEGNWKNRTVPSSVNANLACLLGAYAGRAGTEMTWTDLLKNDEKIEIDMSGLVS
ncbi:MAG TPA: Gfo/Idh/MocA family oxidoreductase [Pirellulales bacterium]|nr:Gfo/Idh/MocA family oxidoreductase [Pirellulales bacterium]